MKSGNDLGFSAGDIVSSNLRADASNANTMQREFDQHLGQFKM